MYIELLRYELKLIFRHKFLKILFVGLGLVVLLGGYNGYVRVEKQLTTIQEVKEKEEKFYTKNFQVLDSIEKKLRPNNEEWYRSPTNILALGAFGNAGKYAILRPSALSFFSIGQSDIYPYYSKINIFSENAGADNQNFENPFALAIGKFDLSFVCIFLLPLFVIAFSYNILSSEKEYGTLVLISSMPISTLKWLFLKLSIRALLFYLLLFFWLFLAIGLFAQGISDAIPELILVLFYISLYVLFWFGVAYTINYVGTTSASNALALVGIWLFFVLILPSIANLLATFFYPIPSRTIYVIEKEELESKVEKQKEKILQDFYAKNPHYEKEKNNRENWKVWYRENFALHNHQQELQQELDTKFENYATSQREFALGFRWLSPTILLHYHLNKSAQTDTQTYKTFQYDTQQFRQKWSAYFIDMFYADKELTTKDFADFPNYQTAKTNQK